jgi:transketolase
MTAARISIEQLAINTIRTLSMDAVQAANSGHPGTPMALAPVAYTLWNHYLRFAPAAPAWPARDRFVLSCGHASMLLYSMLHLAGVKKLGGDGRVTDELAMSLDDIKNFRQLGSPCAGHPEFGEAAGIETTTGPLGQGVGNSVGMAIAAQWRAARYNRPGFDLWGYNVYALASDGDLMEGVGCEAASLAGHLALSNLCWIYDDNHITIEGDTKLAFSEDVGKRFEGLGWQVVHVDDANDLAAIRRAIETFLRTGDRPTLIIVRSVIAWGSPHKANTHDAHGSPLGHEEVRRTKSAYGWPEDETFLVPVEVRRHFEQGIGARGNEAYQRWQVQWNAYRHEHARAAAEAEMMLARELPPGWDSDIPTFTTKEELATRVSSGKMLNSIARRIPWLIGGAADLAPSTMTLLGGENDGDFAADHRAGRNFHFGVREHAMAAVGNGLALSGLRPYVATFFIFSDYLRPSMRLSSIMHQPVLYIYTHDSIGLGEDGPTHQPIEHLAACRAIPGLVVIRPADANEVAEAYRVILPMRDRPVALVLSRQKLPTLCREKYAPARGLARGAYVLADAPNGHPDVILIGSGSEVDVCLKASETLVARGISARVVSMPSWELFDEQDQAYRESVLPPSITARVAVEAGVQQGWEKYLGPAGRFVGMKTFGASAPYTKLYEHFGITAENVVAQAKMAMGLS